MLRLKKKGVTSLFLYLTLILLNIPLSYMPCMERVSPVFTPVIAILVLVATALLQPEPVLWKGVDGEQLVYTVPLAGLSFSGMGAALPLSILAAKESTIMVQSFRTVTGTFMDAIELSTEVNASEEEVSSAFEKALTFDTLLHPLLFGLVLLLGTISALAGEYLSEQKLREFALAAASSGLLFLIILKLFRIVGVIL